VQKQAPSRGHPYAGRCNEYPEKAERVNTYINPRVGTPAIKILNPACPLPLLYALYNVLGWVNYLGAEPCTQVNSAGAILPRVGAMSTQRKPGE